MKNKATEHSKIAVKTNGTKLSEINKENGKEILLNFNGGEQKHIEIDVDVKDGNTALISSKSNIELPKQGRSKTKISL